MSFDPLYGFVFLGLFSPGPNVILITTSGARFGVVSTLPHMFGVVLGVGVTSGLTGLGIGGLLFFAVPLLGLLARTPWSDLPDLLTSSLVVDALRLSAVSSLGATVIAADVEASNGIIHVSAQDKGTGNQEKPTRPQQHRQVEGRFAQFFVQIERAPETRLGARPVRDAGPSPPAAPRRASGWSRRPSRRSPGSSAASGPRATGPPLPGPRDARLPRGPRAARPRRAIRRERARGREPGCPPPARTCRIRRLRSRS